MIRKRHVALLGDVNLENCDKAIQCLYKFYEEDPNEGIDFVITSLGGSSDLAFMVYDTVRFILSDLPVRIIGVGDVQSAAIIVFLSGQERIVTPNTKFFFHEFSRSFEHVELNTSDFQRITLQIIHDQDNYIRVVAEHTNQAPHEVRRWMQKGTFFTAAQAVDIGLAHSVWEPGEDSTKTNKKKFVDVLGAPSRLAVY